MTKLFSSLILVVLFLQASSSFALASAFFTAEEERSITSLLKEANQKDAAQKADLLTLQAIVWNNEADWLFWMNGEKWTPERKDGVVQIISVAPDSVEMNIKQPQGPEEKIRLFVHQTYRLSIGEVSEGE